MAVEQWFRNEYYPSLFQYFEHALCIFSLPFFLLLHFPLSNMPLFLSSHTYVKYFLNAFAQHQGKCLTCNGICVLFFWFKQNSQRNKYTYLMACTMHQFTTNYYQNIYIYLEKNTFTNLRGIKRTCSTLSTIVLYNIYKN